MDTIGLCKQRSMLSLIRLLWTRVCGIWALSSHPLHSAGQVCDPAADERVHDILEAASRPGAPVSPEPGQPHSQQDTRRMVVRPQARGETEIARSRASGTGSCLVVPLSHVNHVRPWVAYSLVIRSLVNRIALRQARAHVNCIGPRAERITLLYYVLW